jgi:hypothetical protein
MSGGTSTAGIAAGNGRQTTARRAVSRSPSIPIAACPAQFNGLYLKCSGRRPSSLPVAFVRRSPPDTMLFVLASFRNDRCKVPTRKQPAYGRTGIGRPIFRLIHIMQEARSRRTVLVEIRSNSATSL